MKISFRNLSVILNSKRDFECGEAARRREEPKRKEEFNDKCIGYRGKPLEGM